MVFVKYLALNNSLNVAFFWVAPWVISSGIFQSFLYFGSSLNLAQAFTVVTTLMIL